MRRSSLAIVLSALVIAVPARGQGRALSIEDYYRVKTVGAPQLSPDGKWVGFTVSRHTEATNQDSSEVWLVTSSCPCAPRLVSRAGTNATAPQWSDDGRLSFSVSGRRLSLNPSAPDSLVESPAVTQSGRGGRGGAGGASMLPSPDGKGAASLRVSPVLGPEKRQMSDFERRAEERFRGTQFDWLNFQQDGAAFPVPNRVDPILNPPAEVYLDDNKLTSLGLRPSGLQWNPDGSGLIFTADSGYRDERKYQKGDVYFVSRAGVIRKLTSDRDMNYTGARYSPDGKWILYTRQLSTNAVIAQRLDHGGATDLAVIPAAGGPERNLTIAWDYLPAGAQWSPDSKYIYFTGGIGGTTHLFRVSPSAGVVEQMTKGERRVSGISFSDDFSTIAYTVGQYEAPSEIWASNVDGTNERQLTHVHAPFTAEVALNRAERLQFKSKDGTPIEGWLTYPHNYRRESGPYPLVVSSHGGPHSADGYGFDFKSQYFAANGYFVLEVNFRSSTGYGEKFLWGTWGAWGDRDGEDVMAGLDYAISRFPIARNRVATIGHSYGGFMTNWLITQYPDRFAAAIPGAGIVNWVSDYGNADIARTKETEFYGTPWDSTARKIMIRQSPLTYAGRVKTPTLFINGEIDQRVPVSEAEQMFVALKKNGVPAKMIRYENMPHSISGSWNNVHRMLNELRWLDQWLKPGKI